MRFLRYRHPHNRFRHFKGYHRPRKGLLQSRGRRGIVKDRSITIDYRSLVENPFFYAIPPNFLFFWHFSTKKAAAFGGERVSEARAAKKTQKNPLLHQNARERRRCSRLDKTLSGGLFCERPQDAAQHARRAALYSNSKQRRERNGRWKLYRLYGRPNMDFDS